MRFVRPIKNSYTTLEIKYLNPLVAFGCFASGEERTSTILSVYFTSFRNRFDSGVSVWRNYMLSCIFIIVFSCSVLKSVLLFSNNCYYDSRVSCSYNCTLNCLVSSTFCNLKLLLISLILSCKPEICSASMI